MATAVVVVVAPAVVVVLDLEELQLQEAGMAEVVLGMEFQVLMEEAVAVVAVPIILAA